MYKLTDLIPDMNHVHFSQFWDTDVDQFYYDISHHGIPLLITEVNTRTLYWLLMAQYANSTIASSDPEQFKNKLFSIVFRFGPTWEKKLDIQSKLRALTETEMATGTKQIINRAEHPGTTPTTSTLEDLGYINEQNTVSNKRDKLTAYSNLVALLEDDVTSKFLDKFKVLFLKCVAPQRPLLYVTDEEEEE